jgi:DNA polymerase-4
VARTVSVKLRLASFKTITRSKTLPQATDVAREIYSTACALYAASGLSDRARLRLVGVRASGLRPVSGYSTQLALGDRPAGWREAEQALDKISRRFGDGMVRPARLFPTGGPGSDPGPGSYPGPGGNPADGGAGGPGRGPAGGMPPEPSGDARSAGN